MADSSSNSSNGSTNNGTNGLNSSNTRFNQTANQGSKNNNYRRNLGFTNNGYRGQNNYNRSNNNDEKIKNTLENVKQKQKKFAAKKTLTEMANAYNPMVGAAVDRALETKEGDKLLDEFAKGSTPAEGMKNVKVELDKKRRRTNAVLFGTLFGLPLLLFILLLMVVFKNADSQIFSNENGGTVESDNYQYDDPDTNIFKNYPGLYEKVVKMTKKVSDKYQLEIDKYLIISTLVAPIENGLIIPVDDGSCGENECYYFKDKSYTWTGFLDVWGDQAELLAKMQILTFVNEDANMITCGSEETMEQYAKNDFEIREHYAFWWINPLNWFSTFRNAVDAELNAKCTLPPNGKTIVPVVYTLSTELAEYYPVTYEGSEDGYVKDPNSGGVYFWNLVKS